MRSFWFTLNATLVTTALALGGCAAGDSSDEAEAEATRTSPGALMNTGAGGGSRWCEGGYCTCTGDADCNDMFSSGVCADGLKTAICHINSADVPRCRCLAARVSGGGDDGVAAPFYVVRAPIGNLLRP
jgi:hypothetical protein